MMELDQEWTVVGTLDELPDQTMDQLMARPEHIFPRPQSTTQRLDQLIPETVTHWYHELQKQQQQRDNAVKIADAFRHLSMSKTEEEKKYMTDDERRKMKIVERLRAKLRK